MQRIGRQFPVEGSCKATLLSSQTGPRAVGRGRHFRTRTPDSAGSRIRRGQAPAFGSYRTGAPARPAHPFNTGNTRTARAVASFLPSWMSRVRVSSPAPTTPSHRRRLGCPDRCRACDQPPRRDRRRAGSFTLARMLTLCRMPVRAGCSPGLPEGQGVSAPSRASSVCEYWRRAGRWRR